MQRVKNNKIERRERGERDLIFERERGNRAVVLRLKVNEASKTLEHVCGFNFSRSETSRPRLRESRVTGTPTSISFYLAWKMYIHT